MPDHTLKPAAASWADASSDSRRRPTVRLSACDDPLRERYDVAMLDLDGVVYRGEDAIEHVAENLAEAHKAGLRLAYVTNNAARTPDAVVAKLRGLGMPTDDDGVVTSAQAAGRLLAGLVPAGSRVLVVGGEGLRRAVEEHGLVVVTSADDEPAAVVQGFSPDLGWKQLAEAAYAVSTGIPWVASNTDGSIPTARGLAPGNGTLVAAVATATGRRPEVAGKPYPPLFDETVLRVGGSHPLVVGDRLDTDIEGANNVGADSLLVLTGVSDLDAVVTAAPPVRPTYVAPDLRALSLPQTAVEVVDGSARCGRHTVRAERGALVVDGAPGVDEPLSAVELLRAVVALSWHHHDEVAGESGSRLDLSAVRAALGGWGVR
ncbi:HAD-IIA family hydrolase [Mumia sp. zg.B17]|uniref:HAD-IIA family hydrolase n=1 Tax=Mumia sp. zg.B17 TaxID=2855446 RepID=UPI001C6DD599|nr:HAD-IIA family hydrolase [Mumia sp. zg.B17]MBW9204931.1 HAD-IIA family hydrolase [Mumia sp. zg.B17]